MILPNKKARLQFATSNRAISNTLNRVKEIQSYIKFLLR